MSNLEHYAKIEREMTAMELPRRALEESVLVVAHPDDEVLWFSSILDTVTSIVIVFMDTEQRPDRDDARRASLAEHEFRDKLVSLDLAQVVGTYLHARHGVRPLVPPRAAPAVGKGQHLLGKLVLLLPGVIDSLGEGVNLQD